MTQIVQRESSALQIAAQAGQLLEVGSMLIKSGMLPTSIRTPEAAMAIIIKGMELGLPPMAALNGITVIQGKATVSPQLMLSLINRSGQLETIDIETGAQGATVTMKRRGRSPFTARFGPAEAKAMQLDGKDNYKKQAPVMYQWRAVAGCARVVFPDVIDGLYTLEEMGADVQVDEDGAMTVSVQQEAKAPTVSDSERLDKAVRAIGARVDECRVAGRLSEAQAFLHGLNYQTNLTDAEKAFKGLRQFTVPAPVEAQEAPVEAEIVSSAPTITDAQRKTLMGHLGRVGVPNSSEARTAFYVWFVQHIPAGTRTNDLTEEDAQGLIDLLTGLDNDEAKATGEEFKREVKL